MFPTVTMSLFLKQQFKSSESFENKPSIELSSYQNASHYLNSRKSKHQEIYSGLTRTEIFTYDQI